MWWQRLPHISFHLCMCKDEKRGVAIQDESIRNPILQLWDRVCHCCSQSMRDASNTLNWNYLIRRQIGLSRQWLLWLFIMQTQFQGHNPGAWVYTCQTGAENRQKAASCFLWHGYLVQWCKNLIICIPPSFRPSICLSIHPSTQVGIKKIN